MKQNFYLKLGIIISLMLALMLPQGFIFGLVQERESWRAQAHRSIGQSWPNVQTLAGPVLSLPYKLTYNIKEERTDVNGKTTIVSKELSEPGVLYIIPKKLNIDSKLDSSLRYRGIYGVPVYTNTLQFSGEFSTKAVHDFIARHKDQTISWEKPKISVLVSDQRGITAPPSLAWQGGKIDFEPGSNLPGADAGMHAILPDLPEQQAGTLADADEIRIPFTYDMNLRGMEAVHFALLAESIGVNLASNWLHPSFTGELLPEQHDITAQGFSAHWQASSFSYNVAPVLERCRKGDCSELLSHAVGVSLIQPVDVYQQAERSIKYAALFIILTFVVLILFELMKKVRVHPIQYSLVGMALLVFYLLLVSLSEHIPFISAYALGASASTVLLTLYFGAILHSGKLGLLLGGGLSALYASLYFILQAEDNALLMGSVLVFGLLAALMLVTRNFDWYALTAINTKREEVQ
jgi:inner membrane protein